MENKYYSDEEEKISIHSNFAFFENNKLPKLNWMKKDKKEKFDNYFRKSRNKDLKNNIKIEKQKFSSPIIHKTKVLEEFPNFKTFSANHNLDKKNIKIYSNMNTQKTHYQTKTENESMSKNSSSTKVYNNNFPINYINNVNNNNSKTINQFRSTKKKITLKLTKKELDFKTLRDQSHKNYLNFQSDNSNNYNTEEMISDDDNINSLSNIHLDNLDDMNNELSENNDEDFFSQISSGSNKGCIIIPTINPIRKTTRNLKNRITIITRTKNLINPKELNIRKQNTVKFNKTINNKNNILVRKFTKGRNEIKHKTEKNGKEEIIIVSKILDDYPILRRNIKRQSYIIQKPLEIDINKYLNKQREKIKIMTSSFEKKNFNLNKNNYIINVIYKEINNIIEQTNQIKDNKKEKDFKEIMKSIFKNFCQKSIPINILKEFELLIINYFFSVHKIRLIPNFHYIYNNFFDCYNFIVYYIYDGQYKEKEFSQRKSSIIDNNLKILDSIKNISPKQFKTKNKIYNIKKTNKQFINFFFSNDLPLYEKSDNEEKKEKKKIEKFLISRKITRKKRRISFHDLKLKTEKRKSLLEESNKKSPKNEDEHKNILLKFYEANKVIEKWNPLKKESLFHIRLVKDDTEEKLKMKKLENKRKKLLKTKWKQDMEILKSLGGDPLSKHCSLIKTQEIEKENSNTIVFNKLLELLEKNQNELFFEQFINLRFRDIDHQEKYTGDTLLMRAVKIYNIHVIQYLLDKKCNINIQNYELNTALHYAYMYNRNDLINILISHGADESIVNKNGNTPWECMKNYD